MDERIFFGLFSLFLSACRHEGVCLDSVPDEAMALRMEAVPWSSGPDSMGGTGFTGEQFSNGEAWETYLVQNGLVEPLVGMDFSANDLLLYERTFNGCDWDVVFDGAYLFGDMRAIRSIHGEVDENCTANETHHVLIALELVEGSRLRFCEPREE